MKLLWRRVVEGWVRRLWAVPVLATIVAVASAKLMVMIDRSLPQSRRAWYLFGGEAESGRELLSTIASSLITLTGVTFSITILVLQLASSQYSPRVLSTFLEDRGTRFSLGAFIGSFVYALAVLPELRNGGPDGAEFVPALSTFIAFLLALVSVVVFARYINQMAQSIRVIRIVERIAASTRAAIEDLFPPQGAGPGAVADRPPASGGRLIENGGRAGVVASVDTERLIRLARCVDGVIEVVPHLGDFVPRGAPLLRIWMGPEPELAQEAVDCVALAGERTVRQDPTFGLRQLVDIAERALSPALNDPTTAVQVLDQLHDLLRTLATRAFPSTAHRDGEGRLRLMLSHPGWDEFVHLALDEIRQSGAASMQVMRRMRSLICDLLTAAPLDRRAVLSAQMQLLDRAVERGFPEPAERALSRPLG